MNHTEQLAFATLRQANEARVAPDGARTDLCLDEDGVILIAPHISEGTLRITVPGPRCVVEIEGETAVLRHDSTAQRRFAAFFPACNDTPVRLNPTHITVALDGTRTAVDAAAFRSQDGFPPDTAARMVAHMNDDHVDALRDYCRYANVSCVRGEPVMLSVDRHGFFLRADTGPTRFEFPAMCESPLDVRKALVAMVKLARAETGK